MVVHILGSTEDLWASFNGFCNGLSSSRSSTMAPVLKLPGNKILHGMLKITRDLKAVDARRAGCKDVLLLPVLGEIERAPLNGVTVCYQL